MKTQITNQGAVTRAWRGYLPILLMLLTLVSTALAGNGSKHGPKAAPDIDNFPVNPDGTVSVIVQLSPGTPPGQVKNFAKKINQNLTTISAVAANVPLGALDKLLAHGWVTYVSPDRPNKPMWDDAAPPVNAGVARQNYGVDGTGIGIAVIDSGVYPHDDLKTADMSSSRIVYSESFVVGDASTNDAYGHGTHVAGILAGNGHDSGSGSGYSTQYVGIAPNANIINLRVLDANGGGSDSTVIAGINRAIQLKSQYNIRVLNLSLGRKVYESYTLDPLCQAVESAWKAGIVVVVAAGNMGRDNSWGEQGYATIEAPGNDPNVITVGAMSPNGTWTRTDDIVSSYSSKGPSLVDHVLKPDIMAPGNKITSLLSPGSTLSAIAPSSAIITSKTLNTICDVVLGVTTCGGTSVGPQYLQLSGTSMATPVVSAGAALMVQANPNVTPDTIKARMMKTAWKGYPAHGNSHAHDIKGNDYMAQYDAFTIGSGYLDIQAAMGDNTTANGGAPSPTVVFDPTTKSAKLVNGLSVVWGQTVVWGQSMVWGQSVVWGQFTVDATSLVWGNSVVWGQTDTTACSLVWGASVVWGQLDDGTLNALSSADPGDVDDGTVVATDPTATAPVATDPTLVAPVVTTTPIL